MNRSEEPRSALLDAAVDLMGRAGRGGAVRVRGRSMVPTLLPGDLLAVEFSVGRYRRGDLLLFRQEDYLVVHRLVWFQKDPEGGLLLRCRGDHVSALDAAVSPGQVIGRVSAVRRAGTWRSVATATGRAYGWLVAWHAAFWALKGRFARRLERLLGSRLPLAWWTLRVDRSMLHLAHRVLFAPANPPVQAPPEATGVTDRPGDSERA